MGKIKDNGLIQDEPLIFEQGGEGRKGYSLPEWDVEELEAKQFIPLHLLREGLDGFPQLSEIDVVRHFTRLSQWNYGIDSGFYPLGSCTMKYNPKINEEAARMKGFASIHPYQPESLVQGILRLMYELEGYLAEITGMDHVTLQPAAGAHGELTGMMMIRAFFEGRGEKRRRALVPDTAHGTNCSTSAVASYQMTEIKSNERGVISPRKVAEQMDENVAAIMVTNPNTLGLFEEHLPEIAEIVHSKGGFVYCDGANLNALMGIAKLGDLGVDMVHLNLHKTFSTPHGGGGPGSGPLAVKKELSPFLPIPVIEKEEGGYRFNDNRPRSIGRMKAFYGNFGVILRAYAYLLSMGAEGLKRASEMAVLNANYLMMGLKGSYYLPYDRPCMHECVFTDRYQEKHHVSTLDIAKRLIDYGYHPPTIYFPLVVKGALMMEPTETESKEGIDRFIETMIVIAKEAEENPDLLRQAPRKVKVRRLDEVMAARKPKLKWTGDREDNNQ
ncbi:MAG: glycine dehydrogenase (aminomethyl-transferring) [Deltaproteobacteria bacterium RBG_16_49_23]|nr:MAG: glycine dehydrogenase (aminomethyl-transferring) [Deltaproteobacteria bacterium RBG_16_49_23]